MRAGYYKYVIVISLLLGVIPIQVLSRTLQEDISHLSQTTNTNQFTTILQQIKFKDIFNNETVKRSLSPKYKSDYLELIANTDNLVEVIDVDSLMSHFHAERNVTNMRFLRLVLENMDALIAVNHVDWSSYIINSEGGRNSQQYYLLKIFILANHLFINDGKKRQHNYRYIIFKLLVPSSTPINTSSADET